MSFIQILLHAIFRMLVLQRLEKLQRFKVGQNFFGAHCI